MPFLTAVQAAFEHLAAFIVWISQHAGNPTFQTPGIQAFSVNASISGADDRGRAASFPLWAGGGRRALASALLNDTLPDDLVGQYTADQIRLMCVAEVRTVFMACCLLSSNLQVP